MSTQDVIAVAGLCGITILLMVAIVTYVVLELLLNRKGGGRRNAKRK